LNYFVRENFFIFVLKPLFFARFFFLFFLTLSCTSAKTRFNNTSILDTHVANDPSSRDVLHELVKSGTIYYDYELVLNVDVILANEEYIKIYHKELQKIYNWSKTESEEILNQSLLKSKTFLRLIVLSQQVKNKKNILKKNNWKIFWKDRHDSVLPANFKNIVKENSEIVFLSKYISSVDRWTDAYEILFPNLLDDSVPFSGSLNITGLKGSLVIDF